MEIICGDIFIFFWNIYSDIAFNRAMPIKRDIFNESSEKTIANPATS